MRYNDRQGQQAPYLYDVIELSFFTALNESQHRIDIFADS
jgi:hypothetical protein